MSTQQDINAIRAQRLANTHDSLALMANTQTSFHPDQSSHITYIQHPQPNNHFVQQPSFNTNYTQQPMKNLEDSLDPTNAMNMALALLAKAFKVRHNVVQNDGNEVGQNAVQNPGIQIVENMNGLSIVLEIANQYGNGNVVIASAEGNDNGINDAYEETERVKVNCTSEDTLQQASTSGTRSDNAPVYDSDGSTEVPKDKNCYDHDIFNMLTYEVQYTDLQTELDRTKEKLENCIIKKEKEYVVLWNNWFLNERTHKRYETNTKFTKQFNLGNPPSSYKPKLYFVTPFPKSSVLPKVDKTNALSKPVTSNSAPSIRESKGVQTVGDCPLESLDYHSKTSRGRRQCFVTGQNMIFCMLNYVNDMNTRADNQSANVSKLENRKKHKANVRKSKELGSQGSLVSSRPSKTKKCP
ncbi:hypothetical protein Tco_0826509 [Tanacetum coccineum]